MVEVCREGRGEEGQMKTKHSCPCGTSLVSFERLKMAREVPKRRDR